MILKLLKYRWLSFSRLKMSPFIAPPDFIAILISLILIGGLTTIYAFEESLVVSNNIILNYNYISIFIYITLLFFEAYIQNFYSPNFYYLKLTIPVCTIKLIWFEILLEMFSYKFVFILTIFFVSLFLSGQIKVFHIFNFLGWGLILAVYLNVCLLIIILRYFSIKKSFHLGINFLKLMLSILLIMFILNKSNLYLNFKSIQTFYTLLFINLFVTLILTIKIWMLYNYDDKI